MKPIESRLKFIRLPRLLSLFCLLAATLLDAATLDEWHWRSPMPQGNDLYAMTYAEERFVAVGDYGTILNSFDGVVWTVHSLEAPLAFRGIAHGNGRFVAVGSADAVAPDARSVIWTSEDGANWNEQSFPFAIDGALVSVAFGNGRFVAVGHSSSGSFLSTSSDGIGWTFESLPAAKIHDVTFANGQFIAAGTGGLSPFPGWWNVGPPVLLTSPNGISWTPRDVGSNGTIYRVAHGNGRIVAVGREDYPSTNLFALTSTNAVNWARATFPTLTLFASVADLDYGNGSWVLLVGDDYPNADTVVFTSSNGMSWIRQNPSNNLADVDLRTLAFGGGRFAAAGWHGNLATSFDPSSWSVWSSGSGLNLRGVSRINSGFVAVGNDGVILTSPDGAQWIPRSAPTSSQNVHHVTTGGGVTVAVGSQGMVLTSLDGIDWTLRDSKTTRGLFDVVHATGLFVAVGGDTRNERLNPAIITSEDGINWTSRLDAGAIPFRLHGVTHGNGLFVAVGQPGVILTSTNGVSWDRQIVYNAVNPGSVDDEYLKSVAFGNGMFVAVGEGGASQVVSSTDGMNWTNRPTGLMATAPNGSWLQLDEVIFSEGLFIAVGDRGTIMTSSNGLDWTMRHSSTTENLRGVAGTPGGAMVVGNNDIILQAGPISSGCDPFQNWLPVKLSTNVPLHDVVFGAGRFVAVGDQFLRAVSTDGTTWSNQVFQGLAPANLGVAYGNGLFVGVATQTGGFGFAWASTNGLALTASGGTIPNPTGVAFGDGVFVIVGTNGFVFTTTNGQAVVQRPSGTTNLLTSVAYGSGRFVAVGNNGTVRVSTNKGTNWTTGISGTSVRLADVTYGNGLFVAVGVGGALVTSPNGLTWTAANAGTVSDLAGVAFGGGVFVALHRPPSGRAAVSVSTDGEEWEVMPLPVASPMNDIAYGNGSFVAVGQSGEILVAGVLLTLYSTPSGDAVCVGDRVMFAVGAASSCAISYQWRHNGTNLPGRTCNSLTIPMASLEDDGTYTVFVSDGRDTFVAGPAILQVKVCRALDHWTQVLPPPVTNTLNGVACGPGGFVAVGVAGGLVRSVDGATWTTAASPTNATLNGVTYGNDRFVAVGLYGAILTSSNTVDWIRHDSGTDRALRGVVYGGGVFVAVGDLGVVLSSTDAVAWTPRDPGTNRTFLAVTYGNGQFISAGTGGTIITSPDGVVWTPRSSGPPVTLHGVAWGGGVIVAVGNAGAIRRSTNGVDWTSPLSPVTGLLSEVIFAHGQFVAVGEGGILLSSSDGGTWVLRDAGASSNLIGITSCGDTYFAVGAGGTILQSAFAGAPVLGGEMGEAGFALSITGEVGAPYRVQASPAMPGDWLDLLSFTNVAPYTVILDSTATNLPARFYRVISP